MRFTHTREGQVAFLEARPAGGSAKERPPLVLVHGFTGHREDFAEVLPSLARHRRVLVPDIRGHGDSSSDSGSLGWTFEQLVNDLLAFLDDRGVDLCDLLGHSLGGFVALRFALEHPERVRSLVFVSTAPETPAGLARAPFDRAAEIAEAHGVQALQTLVEKVGRAAATPAVARRGEDYWDHHRRRYGAVTPASYRGLGESFFDSVSYVDRLGEIEQPCLVMVGEEDEPWLPGAALFEQNLPQATRVTIPGAEHHPHQENPEAFLEAIERHLAIVEATSASSRATGTTRIHQRETRMSGQTEEIQITTSKGETMNAYLARPDGEGPWPAVIVYMEIFGVNDHIRDVTRRVAAEGYVAIAPDYFHRTGPGIELAYDDDGMAEGMKHLGQLQADQMIADARDTIACLRGREDVVGDRIGAMGFCIGGHMTYLTACETDIKAAASYYGGGIAAPQGPGGGASTVSRTGKISGRINCYFGGQDAMIPMDQVEAIKQALADAGTRHEVHVYEAADHGFHCDQRATYHEASAKDAWEKTKALFASELRG